MNRKKLQEEIFYDLINLLLDEEYMEAYQQGASDMENGLIHSTKIFSVADFTTATAATIDDLRKATQ